MTELPESVSYCFTCGALCATAGSDEQKKHRYPVRGKYHGEWTCDICIGNYMLGGFEVGDSDIVYISSDGRSFTTWGGTQLGRVQELGGKGGIWNSAQVEKFLNRLPVRVTHWSGVTLDGVLVYGKTMGHGMAATAHVRRSHGRVVVEAGSPAAVR